jgi:succinylglutamate desuccinylase
LLATDKNGDITTPTDGFLLMPLYQKQGEEGFFVVRDYKFPLAY